MEAIISALETIRPQGDFCVRLSVPVDDLEIRIGDAEPLAFPLTHDVARALISQAQPAKFGWRDQTLQDSKVRDTWEIPRSRVKIDKRRWNKTLHPLLTQIKAGLGLGEDAKLNASLHNLLIYEKGQFFQPHQDSEKEDGMVATLVVVLPCAHTGGGLVIDHCGVKKRVHTSRAASDQLTCVAFYADCHHEVKPLTSGYRVVLTYNLLLEGTNREMAIPVNDAVAAPLTRALRDYFDRRASVASAQAPDFGRAPTPPKWVYLLDHQYTEKSLSWRHLKNGDRLKADAIAQAAAQLGLERYIALADIQEIWDCEADYDDYFYRSRSRSRRRSRYYDYDDEDDSSGGEQDYQLIDLIDNSISLRHWLSGSQQSADFAGLRISDDEVCWTKASDQFDPFSSQYEGWMGNYGNTLERWYHRAAIVLWRKEDRYAMLCEVDPRQLVKDLNRLAKEPSTRVEAQQTITSVMPYWSWSVTRNREVDNLWAQAVFGLALQIDQSEIAQALVSPFGLEVLNDNTAKAFTALEKHYGTPWSIGVLEQWSQCNTGYRRHQLIDGFYPLIDALCQMSQADSDGRHVHGNSVIDWLINHQFNTLVANHADQQKLDTLMRLTEKSTSRVESAGELLNACVMAGNAAMHTRVVGYLVDNEALYDPVDLAELVLRLKKVDGEAQAWGHPKLRRYVVDQLTDEFSKPVRKTDDWAITQTVSCTCADCKTLNAYLQASSERQKVWPLAQGRRAHIHRAIDGLGVPVTHQTRREGRPYQLVLSKTDDLFKREAVRRKRVEQALGKLQDVA
ncbi:MAG: 2OG-Fe(II) oxygenase [Candidatus Competibacteraceae bacterium]|nr:2OG-Fe(II) oxygenase [Candidatus Competibacteraceae bacterium]